MQQHSSLPELRRVVRFPLNPESIHRNQSAADARRVTETITLDLPLHVAAGDAPSETAETDGVYPLVAALEEFFATQAQPPTGNLFEILTRNQPWVFLSLEWGERRIPVRITELLIDERQFTGRLKPSYAMVHLVLRVLTRQEAAAAPPARSMLDDYLALRSAFASRA